MAATWLADALRAGGCRVDEGIVPDWKRRGHTDGGFSPIGVLGHHTAGPVGGDYPSLGTVRDGRPGLPGPLANLGLTRSGVWFPVAAGRAWHAGAGSCRWVPRNDGNGHLIGIEAESSGRGDWTPAQLEAYPRGVAALLRDLGVGADRFIAHKEWAPGRKTDPAGWPGDMNGFRATVARILNGDNDDMTPAQAQTLNDILAEVMAARRQDLLQLGAKIDGYGARVERIDEGAHGGWGYGARIEGIEASVVGYGQRVENIESVVVALQAAIGTLATSGATSLTAEQIEAAVAKALQENIVKVDVDVAGQPAS
jgi:hypothetical protein